MAFFQKAQKIFLTMEQETWWWLDDFIYSEPAVQ